MLYSKIANRGDPVVILVSDSEDNHAGQVVVPGVTIPPRPTDPSVVLTDNSRLCVVELEQTKKTEIGFGRLYFWIWVEEYRKEESKTRGTKGSILSLHHHKDKGSIPNSLNYSGSVISLSSNNDEYKKKKKWYKKSENHTLHVPGVIPHSRSPLNSISNIKSLDNGYNPFDYYHQQLNEDDGVIEEKDGSVLGAYSELTANSLSSSSAFVANQLKRRNSMHSRNGLVSSDVDVSREDSSEQLKAKPELMRIAPKCGPSSGGTELTIYCRFLTTKIMEEASVFVGDHSVSRQDWFLNESSQNDLSQLRIHMPALPPGRYPLYIDSAEFGRVRCNQEFTYLQSNENSSQPPASNLAVSSMSESTIKVVSITPKVKTSSEDTSGNGAAVFNRLGSQRSNIVLVDRRSGRRERSRPEALGRSDSVNSSTIESSSKMETKHHEKVDNAHTHVNGIVNLHISDSRKELSSQGKSYNDNDIDSNFYQNDHASITVKIFIYILHLSRFGSQCSAMKIPEQSKSSKISGNRQLIVVKDIISNDQLANMEPMDRNLECALLKSPILERNNCSLLLNFRWHSSNIKLNKCVNFSLIISSNV
ncbi:Immunoglobulin E set isoform 2, partial [Schistosoma japonicum]